MIPGRFHPPRSSELLHELLNDQRLTDHGAVRETISSSGPDTEWRRAMLMVSVQAYDIADVREVFGEGVATRPEGLCLAG
jgi:hypothetical protein